MDQTTLRRLGRRLGHSTNRIGLSTELIGSAAFNDDPLPLPIAGVREMNAGLFEMLAQAEGRADAADAFLKYMVAAFDIDAEQHAAPIGPDGRRDGTRPFRSSFLRLLIGWGWESNGPEGAVLKGWVESRFGLFPTFHKAKLTEEAEGAWAAYVEEAMASAFHTNAILTQLDLLYEYCQWVLTTSLSPEERHLTLYRGVNAFEEHQILARIDPRTVVLRLNNLTSFSSDREVADCFGDIILTVRVPKVKVMFFNALLPFFPLKAEGEFLVIGGDYLARTETI
ncbi:NAD(+)--dinitrogen-reductase ADP-D-ribosyltransferase [Rhodospirillum rubrum]|uniref:NAD(+)--dinitrogen-reductase ADP-D-ribosyltransferase n=1 Tax=Rhodospirillum rubrum TaxID=1085 RepID=UPI0019087DD4|nr:NAD(+)--dinitrogen-reductase ADP-D-ribosyltransferase [Rhodospirillum rubrum]